MDQEKRGILERIMNVSTDTQSDNQKVVNVSVMNSALKILKSILFMGYAVPEMKLLNLPMNNFEKPKLSQDMEIIRDQALTITYDLLEKMKKLRLANQLEFAHSEYCDLEFQHNLFTICILIINLESHPSTKPRRRPNPIDIKDYVDLFLNQFPVDPEQTPSELVVFHIQVLGVLSALIDPRVKLYGYIFKNTVSTILRALKKLAKQSPSPQQKEIITEGFYVLCVKNYNLFFLLIEMDLE